MSWCDFPIGSGRLMMNLHCNQMLGCDLSPAFLDYSGSLGINVKKADLLDNSFSNEFDLVTCLHTLYAFPQYQDILRGHIKSLRKDGILIFEVPNKLHARLFQPVASRALNSFVGMSRKDIRSFFLNENCIVLEITPHAFYDNAVFSRAKKIRAPWFRWINLKFYNSTNFLYFRFPLFRKILRLIQTLQPAFLFSFYLVAVRKR